MMLTPFGRQNLPKWSPKVPKIVPKEVKIEPKSKQKSKETARAAKIGKNTLLGTPFFAQSRFLGDFGAPAGGHFEPKSVVFDNRGQHFWVTKTRADDGSVPRALPEASRGHSGGSGHPPGAIFKALLNVFLITFWWKS